MYKIFFNFLYIVFVFGVHFFFVILRCWGCQHTNDSLLCSVPCKNKIGKFCIVFLIVDRKLYRESIYSASTEGGIRHTFRNFDTLGVFLRKKKRFLASQAPKNRYFIARFVKGDKSFLILHMSWVILKKFSCSLFQYIVQWSFLSLMMEKYLQDKGNLLLLSEN